MLFVVSFTVVAVAALLVAERRGSRVGVWIAKPLASTGFVATALAAGALESNYGHWVLAALIFSWFGDVLLIPLDAPRVFLAGVLSFLTGHLVFAAAFVTLGLDPLFAVSAAAVMFVPLAVVLRWLGRHLSREMRAPVFTYVSVISAMVVCAAGAVGAGGRPTILLGALLFAASDVSVARDRFVESGFSNTVWGLPLYFGAQLVLASTVR